MRDGTINVWVRRLISFSFVNLFCLLLLTRWKECEGANWYAATLFVIFGILFVVLSIRGSYNTLDEFKILTFFVQTFPLVSSYDSELAKVALAIMYVASFFLSSFISLFFDLLTTLWKISSFFNLNADFLPNTCLLPLDYFAKFVAVLASPLLLAALLFVLFSQLTLLIFSCPDSRSSNNIQ
jgi:hypothetical protein